MLIGLMPGPKEPKHDTKSQLKLLVKELLEFWNGVNLEVHCVKDSVIVRCVACDIPAFRKVCGFLGHSGVLECSKCLKRFPGCIGERDYSGFDRSQWQLRNKDQHRKSVRYIQKSAAVKQQSWNLNLAVGTQFCHTLIQCG